MALRRWMVEWRVIVLVDIALLASSYDDIHRSEEPAQAWLRAEPSQAAIARLGKVGWEELESCDNTADTVTHWYQPLMQRNLHLRTHWVYNCPCHYHVQCYCNYYSPTIPSTACR